MSNETNESNARERRDAAVPASGSTFEHRLRVAEERLRRLIESATDYAIFSMDRQRRVDFWNAGAQRVFGYRDEEIVGQLADIIFTPEDRENHEADNEAATALREGRAIDERWHLRKDGSRFFASGMMFPLTDASGTFVGFVKITRDLTGRKLADDGVRNAQEQLEARVATRTAELHATLQALREEMAQRAQAEQSRQALLRRLATTQEDERLRLSRELHDEVGQHLAALMLGLNSLEPHLRSTPGQSILKRLQELTEGLGREVHALAVRLRPTVLDDLGLARAVATYVQSWSDRAGIEVEYHHSELEERRLPPEVEVTLYRIIQEALTNVMKHAQAKRVSVVLNRLPREVSAVIEDDGRGFDPDQREHGLGLVGMRERAAQLQGRLTIESTPGGGTTVFVRIPVS